MKGQYIIKKYKNKNINAFGLAEIMVSLSIIAVVLSAMIATIYQSFIVITTSKQKSTAYELIQDQTNALQEYKETSWISVRENTYTNGTNPKYFLYVADTSIGSTTAVNSTTINSTTATTFLTDLRIGDSVFLSTATNITAKVLNVVSDTQFTVDTPFGSSGTQTITRVASYRINNGSVSQSNAGTTYSLSITMDRGLRNNTPICSNYGKLDNSQNSSCTYLEDNHYVWVIIGATWKDITNHSQTVYSKFYINDYDNASKAAYTYGDMVSGSNMNNTTVTNVSGSGNLILTKNGLVYNTTGKYISSIVDTGVSLAKYFSLDYIADIPSATSISVNFRTSSSKATINTVSWVSIDSYCNTIPPTIIPTLRTQCNLYDIVSNPFNGNRYYQVQFILNSTTPFANTPNITSIETFYK